MSKPKSKDELLQGVLNREAWLSEMAKRVEPIFKGFALASYRVTCGWPCANALGIKSRRLGECHAASSSKGGYHEIFISPLLDEPLEVAGTVCHELAHVAAGIRAGHGPDYAKVCRHVGLTKGKPVVAMPGPKLEEEILRIAEKLGDYPHQAMAPAFKKAKPKLSTLSLECPECGCKATMSIRWLLDSGVPTCGCGTEMAPS